MSTLTRPALARPRTALLVVLALIATMIGGLFAATPALAHDELVATTPSAGETVTAAPTSIGLEFSQEMLPEGTFAEVRGEDGADYADGTPTVEGTIVTIPLKTGLPNGEYTVNWQITSSDGHPTQGNWTFTLAAEQPQASEEAPATEPTTDPAEATPVATAPAVPTSAATASTETSVVASPDATTADSGSPVLGIVIGLIVIVAVGAVLAVILLRRRATRG